MKIDILTDANADLLIQNGDFAISNATQSQSAVLMNATYGDLRQFPDAGVGLPLQIGFTSDPNYLSQLITVKLAEDGIIASNIEVSFDKGLVNVSLTTE